MNIETNCAWNIVDKPYATVITPVYNRESTLKRAFESIQQQTFKDFEYIIIDDGSTDTSNAIARDFMNAADIPTMLITKENGGVHTARNAGIKNARGGYMLALTLTTNFCLTVWKSWFEDGKAYLRIAAKNTLKSKRDALMKMDMKLAIDFQREPISCLGLKLGNFMNRSGVSIAG